MFIKKIQFPQILLILLFLFGSSIVNATEEGSDIDEGVETIENKYRPDFMLPDLSGLMRNVNEWNGKVLIVNFWATWCPPCVREMPMFVEAQTTFSPQGVQFVGIAIDSATNVSEFVKDFEGNYPLLVGTQEATIEIAYQFGNEVGVLPYTAVVNPAGKVVFTHMGEMSREMVVEAIGLALDQPADAIETAQR